MAYRVGVAVQQLELRRVEVDEGLTDDDLDHLERRFGFVFSHDHRLFLSAVYPVGDGWMDWKASDDEIRSRLTWPVEGVLAHVLAGDFWPRSWGLRPGPRPAVEALARTRLAAVPALVPLHNHRYVPAAPTVDPAPVFSIYGTDVIYFGQDVAEYIAITHGFAKWRQYRPRARVPFWSDLAEDVPVDDM